MTEWFEGNVIANRVSLHYYRTGGRDGNGKPVLIVATGVTDMGIGYSRVAQALEDDYDVILYDKRGHGYSEKLDTGYTFEEHAADLIDFIAALNVENLRLIAHSGGAAAAIIAAADHPDRVAGLILYEPCWGSGWGGWQATADGMTDWFNDKISMTREELTTKWQEDNPNWTEEELAWQVESKVLVSPHVVQTFQQPEPHWQEALPKIHCPILLLTGDLNNGLITQDDVRAMAALWNDGSVVQIKGAGHMAHYDQYEQFVSAVRIFLADI